MTIREAINKADELCPNQYGDAEKLQWLSDLDGQIFEEILSRHEWNDGETAVESFTAYELTGADEDESGEDDIYDTELLVPAPYEDLYVWALIRQINLYNMEIAKYNQSNALYGSLFLAYSDWYTRTHLPKHDQARAFRL